MNKKILFEAPFVEILLFTTTDVITNSDDNLGEWDPQSNSDE